MRTTAATKRTELMAYGKELHNEKLPNLTGEMDERGALQQACKTLQLNRNCLGNLGTDCRIVVEWIFKEQNARILTGCNWLRIQFNGKFL